MRLAFLLLFLASFSGVSQHYNFISYSVEDGLSQNQVYDIIQDNQGYLWYGTTAGLSRFDGTDFINFSQRDGLYRNQVNDLYLAKNGAIWVATIGGISIYNDEKFTNIPFDSSLEATKINCIIERQDGTFWIGTNGGGIIIVKNGKLKRFTTEQGLLHNTVRTLYEDHEGTLWIGTKLGVNYISEGGIYNLDNESILGASTSHITGTKQDGIWISTFGKGVFNYRNGQLSQIDSRNGLLTDWIKQSLIVNDKIWFASKFGLHEYSDGKIIETYTLENGLPFEDIKCLLKDNENNLWLGSNGNGAFKFSGKAFVNYNIEDGLNDDIILSIDEDKTGKLWLGSYSKGLIVFDKTTNKSINYSSSRSNDSLPLISDNKIWSGLIDKKDRKWIGTARGLNLFTGDSIIIFNKNSENGGLKDEKITAIFECRDGSIWVGMRTGIAKYLDDGTFKNYSTKEGFQGTNIRSILEDKHGNLWCGADNGLFKFNPISNLTSKETINSSISEFKVLCLALDEKERIWVGTDNGLYVKSNSQYSYVATGQDARSNFVNFLLADQSSIWIGTNYGIYNLSYFEENDYRIQAYTNHEGIMNLECNLNAAFKDSDGLFWFGTAGGLVRLDKRKLENFSLENTKVSLRSIQLFNEETDWSIYGTINSKTGLPEDLKLSHSKNTLTFDFILFNYSNPDNVVYQFKLEGFDDAWSPQTSESFAVYRKLPPGEYTFNVRAKTSSGSWTETTSFKFVIDPPFWQTTWFYSLCALALICLTIAIIIWRRSVNQQKREREQLIYKNRLLALEHQSLNASLNRHFIFNALNSIQYYINRQDRISANKYLSSFAKLIRKNLDSSSSGNNYVTLAEELERTELYLSLEHMRFANKFEYEINFNQDIDTESIMLPAMMLQPFIENSIWHGILPMEKPGKITLTLDRMLNGDIKFEIADNGIGVDTSLKKKKDTDQTHDSKGMMITSGRIELLKTITNRNISLKGPYQVYNDAGESAGTKVEIIIPSNTMETFF